MLICDPLRAAEGSERLSSNLDKPRFSVCYVTLNLTPLQDAFFFGMLYPGLKRPG